jgi:hypothetical protein
MDTVTLCRSRKSSSFTIIFWLIRRTRDYKILAAFMSGLCNDKAL